MIPTKEEISKIQQRIKALNKALVIRLSFVPSYAGLTELEKIPLRVAVAEIVALEEMMMGNDLDKFLDKCIENEYYCMAEGIKRVRAWAATKDCG